MRLWSGFYSPPSFHSRHAPRQTRVYPMWKHEGSRHERGYGYDWTKRREVVLQRDGYLCQPCYRTGTPTPATQVDHITPKAQDGTDDYDNLQAICDDCHKAKTARENTKTTRMQFDAKGFPIWK